MLLVFVDNEGFHGFSPCKMIIRSDRRESQSFQHELGMVMQDRTVAGIVKDNQISGYVELLAQDTIKQRTRKKAPGEGSLSGSLSRGYRKRGVLACAAARIVAATSSAVSPAAMAALNAAWYRANV